MSEFKQTVTTSKDQGIGETGAKVQQQTRKVNTDVTADSKSTIANVVWYIVGFAEVLLVIRLALKLFGANSSGSFVSLIYGVTGVLTAPFDSIFGVTTTKSGDTRSVFEPSIVVAIAVYALIGWGIVKLINLNRTET